MRNRRLSISLIVAGLMLAMVGLVTLVFVVGMHVARDVDSSAQGSTRASLVILIFGAIVMAALLSCFLWLLVEDRRDRIPISHLYWPMSATKAVLFIYVLFASPSAADLLIHDLKPRWTILYTPLSRIAQNTCLLLVFAGFAAILGVILSGRGWSRSRLAVLYVVILLATVALVAGFLLLSAGGTI